MSDGNSHTSERLLLENEQLRQRIAELESVEVDRRAAESALRQYEAIVNHSQDFMTLIDRNYRYTGVSDSFCQGLGKDRREIVGHLLGEVWNRDIFEHIMRPRLARCFQGDIVRYEAQFEVVGRGPRHFDVTYSPIFDNQGKVTHAVVVSRDITERTRAEEARHQYEFIVNNSQDLMTLVRRDFRYVAVSHSFCDAHMKQREEIVGHPVSDLWGEEVFREVILPYFSRCFRGEPVHYEARFPVPRYGDRYFSVTATPFRDGQGVITHIVVVSRDIDQRKRAEQQLAESEQRFRSITESLDVVVWLQSLDQSRVEYVNRACERILGKRAGEILESAEALRENVHPDDRWRIEQMMRGHEAGLEYGSAEYRVCLPDGQVRWLRDRSVLIDETEENAARIAGITLDVTEIKAGEERMRQVSRLDATATLAGGVAHDFNNLMVGVLGNAELLLEDLRDKPGMAKMLGEVIESAKRASDLAQKLLAFARGGKYQPRSLDLNKAVADALALNHGIIPESVELTLDTRESLWPVKADPEQVNQIIVNLCLNAVEAMNNGGNLRISTRKVKAITGDVGSTRVGRFVRLSVEDEGCGIPQELQSQVFEPFFTTKTRGRGLGLAAVYGIVENHGGVLDLHSDEGRGTTVHVYLPVSESGLGSVSVKQDGLPRGTETILLIDDETMVLNVSQRILSKLGYTVLTAECGEDAIAKARSHHGNIHAAILDLGMPGMSGEETFPYLKEARPEIKVIVCSGYERDASAEKLLRAGAATFVQKPFSIDELAQSLRTILDE